MNKNDESSLHPDQSAKATHSGVPLEQTNGPAADAQDTLAANYRYWQEHGDEWVREYDQRKLKQPYYHLQELMLADYFIHYAPAKILEFGCGVGRHLSYLTKIPGLEVFGYDQSPTMVAGMHSWANPDWFEEHVVVGKPVGRLPYEDDAFDIVYTAEVLVHVRPCDIDTIISELLRISRWQILHMERSLNVQIVENEHDGCWNHDLPAIYKRFGHECLILSGGYNVQAPYQIVLDSERCTYTWPPVLTSLMRRAENDLVRGRDEATAARVQLEQTLAVNQAQVEQLTAIHDQAQAGWQQERATMQERLSELDQLMQQQQEMATKLEEYKTLSEQRKSEVEHELQMMVTMNSQNQARQMELEHKLLSIREQLETALKTIEQGNQRDQEMRRKYEDVKTQLEQAQGQLKSLEAEREALQQDIAQATQTHVQDLEAEKQKAYQFNQQEKRMAQRVAHLQSELFKLRTQMVNQQALTHHFLDTIVGELEQS